MRVARAARNLTVGYVAALSLIAIFVSIDFTAVQFIVKVNQHSVEATNRAAEQVGAARGVALLASRLAVEANPERIAALRVAIAGMRNVHEDIIYGAGRPRSSAKDHLSTDLKQAYFSPPLDIDARMKDFLAAAERVSDTAEAGTLSPENPDLSSLLKASTGDFNTALERAVDAHEEHSDKAFHQAIVIEAWLWFATIGLLIVEALFIFSPAMKRLTSSVDELRDTKTELAQTVNQLRGAYNAAPYGMGVVNAKGRFISANAALCSLLGYAGTDILDRDYLAFSLPEDREKTGRMMDRLKLGDLETCSFETRMLRSNGVPVPVQISMSKAINRNGFEPHFVIQVVDLSERIKLEAERRKVLRAEAMGELSAGMAHEFNNLFASLRGNIALMESAQETGPETTKRLRKLDALVERGASLTRHVLSYAQRQPLLPKRLLVDRLLIDAKDRYQAFIGAAHRLKLRPSGDDLVLDVDTDRFDEAVFHLLKNARDAAPAGSEIVLECRLCERDDLEASKLSTDRRYLEIVVVDCGGEIADTDLKQFVEPFYTTKAEEGASGLGLSMVDGFARQSGGALALDKSFCGGLRAAIILPLARENVNANRDAARPVVNAA